MCTDQEHVFAWFIVYIVKTLLTPFPHRLKKEKTCQRELWVQHLNSQHILCTSEVKNWTTISIYIEHQQQWPTDFSGQQQLPCTHKPYCGDHTGNSSFKSSSIKISPFLLHFSTLMQKHDGKTKEREKSVHVFKCHNWKITFLHQNAKDIVIVCETPGTM